MSKKVKLPKEVAEAIERFRMQYGTDELFQINKYVGEETAQADAAEISYWMREGNYAAYYTAIVNGYEIELTPTERVREYYKTLERDLRSVKFHRDSDLDKQHHALTRAEMNGVIQTLECLGLHISGVNAE